MPSFRRLFSGVLIFERVRLVSECCCDSCAVDDGEGVGAVATCPLVRGAAFATWPCADLFSAARKSPAGSGAAGASARMISLASTPGRL